MDGRPTFEEGSEPAPPAAARIAAAITLHYVAGDVELVGEALRGLSAEELRQVTVHAAGIAGELAATLLGPENAGVCLRAMLRNFLADEVQA